jgi:phenylacetate-CoA ligase
MNLFFRFTLHFNGFPISQALKMVDSIKYKLNPKHRAIEIFNYHKHSSSFYSNFLERNNALDNIIWENIPVIKKKDFQIDLKFIVGYVNRNELHIHNTSGSSGTPFYFAKDRFCHAMTWAYADFRLLEHGINIGESLQARFYGIPLNGFKYWKERLKDFIARRVRYPVFDLSDENLQKVTNNFYNNPFIYINGYTSSLVIFAKYLIRSNIILKDICPTLRLCMPTSEVCDELDRKTLERGFGVKVVNEYGAAELDLIALQDIDGEWVLNEETLFVEILDELNFPVQPGEEGRVVVTSLYNKAMPFIRYELGDRAILSNKFKNGRRVLEKVTGRINDVIYLPSGKISPGLTFYYISKKILEEGGKINEFIIRQKEINHFYIEYTSESELSSSDIENCQKAMDIYLEPNLMLSFKKVLEIERGNSGKLKHFFSEI